MNPVSLDKPRRRQRLRRFAAAFLAALLPATSWIGLRSVAVARQAQSAFDPGPTAQPVQRAQLRPSDFADTHHWTRYISGNGVRVTPSGNGVDIDFSNGAGSDQGGVAAGYISTFALRGDFSLEVDYTLRVWPALSGVRVGLGIWPSICMIREGVEGFGEVYTFGAGPFSHVPTSDQHGSLRLVRTGGTLSGYSRSSPSDSWTLVSSRADNPVFVQDFQVQVVSWTDSYTFKHQPVGITLANFAMTADRVLHGPYGIPSWADVPPAISSPYTGNGPSLPLNGPAFPRLHGRHLIQPESPTPQPYFPNEPTLSHGILEEDLNLDLDAAAQSYKSLIGQFDAQRPLAANAIFRLGECYRRMGRMDEARVQYNRILREFSDQTVLVRLCQRFGNNVTGSTPPVRLGASPGDSTFGANQPRMQSAACANKLKQMGIAFKTWALDNGDRFPFNVSTNKGGTEELSARGDGGFDRNSFYHFMVMSNELSTPFNLICPGDSSRQPAADFLSLRAANVTYQVRSGANVNEEQPQQVLVRCPIHGNELLCDGSVIQTRPQ